MQVKFEHVVKRFNQTLVVDDLNLEVAEGEFLVLLGPSGCGKTTTLRMLAGLEEVTSGKIYIGETVVNDIPPRYRDVAMVFQSYALYPHMTVAENIGYPLKVRKVRREEGTQRIKEVADLLELGDLLNRKPRELSGGQRQRVALARAIIRHPTVFLMDEPLSNLDAKLRVQMRGELKRLQHELGSTTLYVTHDQAEAMTMGHRIAIMKDGRLQQLDTPINVYNQPANRFVAGFIGSPSMNFIEGEVDLSNRAFRSKDCRVALNTAQLDAVRGRSKVTLGVRPEHIHLSTEPKDDWMATTVYVTELMGNETYVFLKLGEQIIAARAPASFNPDFEDRIWISFEHEGVHLFDSESGVNLYLMELDGVE